jgi:hypothetical protein
VSDTRIFVCDDCGWQWPLKDRGQVIDYCDACTGTMRPVAQGTRSAVGLSPQVRRRLQRVKDTLSADSGRAHTHIETIEYLLRYWEESPRADQ